MDWVTLDKLLSSLSLRVLREQLQSFLGKVKWDNICKKLGRVANA